MYIFTSESVSSGHPDKMADQISDSILDEFLKKDENAKVACECYLTTGLVVVGGEIKSTAHVDIDKIVRNTIKEIGYVKSEYNFDYKSCGIISTLHEQSPDISQGVEKENQGAGDQGIMFGYATNESPTYLPLTIDISHRLLEELEKIRKEGKVMTYLRPDAKSQVSIVFDNKDIPIKIQTILISTQHDDILEYSDDYGRLVRTDNESDFVKIIKRDIRLYLIPRVKSIYKDSEYLFADFDLLVNPTGKFIIGGPHGDTGLTGRKIIVDTYGGYGAHGGGAFSGKDPSKVDRSASYMARYIAKNLVAAGVADKLLIQVSYAIGMDKPISLYVNSYHTSKFDDKVIAEYVNRTFDLTPKGIIENLKLKAPIYKKTATYGHFGRESFIEDSRIYDLEYFTWEKLDKVEKIKTDFKL